MEKERLNVESFVSGVELNAKVSAKAEDYVKRYMGRFPGHLGYSRQLDNELHGVSSKS